MGLNNLDYKPRWLRIFFLAVVLNFFIMSTIFSNYFISTSKVKPASDDLIEIEWTDLPAVEDEFNSPEPIKTFHDINLPSIEIPEIEIPASSEPVVVEKPVQPVETQTKPAKNPEDKLKVIVKVYPKDLIDQLVTSGAIPGKISIKDEKIIVAVTIGVDGKVKNAEIQHGALEPMINFVSKIAASSWIFEPYLDDDGNPKELKTQIEFKPEDF